jgi:hypothetical protein
VPIQSLRLADQSAGLCRSVHLSGRLPFPWKEKDGFEALLCLTELQWLAGADRLLPVSSCRGTRTEHSISWYLLLAKDLITVVTIEEAGNSLPTGLKTGVSSPWER